MGGHKKFHGGIERLEHHFNTKTRENKIYSKHSTNLKRKDLLLFSTFSFEPHLSAQVDILLLKNDLTNPTRTLSNEFVLVVDIKKVVSTISHKMII